MAVRAITDDAQGLLDAIIWQIDSGLIETWAYNRAGAFTHTASSGQWKNKAWLMPVVEDKRLRFKFLKPKDKTVTREFFAVYQGRFIEMLIEHAPEHFTDVRATPNPEKDEAKLSD
jgi:hypothetical protein